MNRYSGNFTLDSLSPEGLSLLVKALDTKDFSDISAALPLIRECCDQGHLYSEALQDAITFFDISKLNEILDDLQTKLKNRSAVNG